MRSFSKWEEDVVILSTDTGKKHSELTREGCYRLRNED